MLPEPLFDVLRAYATLRPPKSIERVELPFSTAHVFLLEHILLNRHFQDYPPSKQYQDEIDERIYAHHIQLMQELSMLSRSLVTSAPPASYMTYLWPTQRPPLRAVYPGYANATLLESRTTIESGTTGLRTWSASLILAQYILDHPELVENRRVLELGCGAGFMGIVAASVQLQDQSTAGSLWLTDVNESVLQRCEDNLRLQCNKSHEHPDLHLRFLDWFDAVDSEGRSSVSALFAEARPDVILGADVVYDPSIIPPLVETLVLALTQPHGGEKREAYIALTQRNEETLAAFLRQVEQRLCVETICTELAARNIFTSATELGQDAAAQTVNIFRIRAQTAV
ncbi:hypothetical protein OH77DRAFT_1492137 [Trametes cingulata]|nr:hypothetical protein OH77DRAFT_1492137 [Trametes cingulata]